MAGTVDLWRSSWDDDCLSTGSRLPGGVSSFEPSYASSFHLGVTSDTMFAQDG